MSNKKLLIVESPAKAKTIGKYLGGDFRVESSIGHIRDLPKKGLSIKITPNGGETPGWTFTPDYEISANKKKVVEDLRKAARECDEIFLAPDPDREGEAIAWHLRQVLADVAKNKPVHRVSYNEITKNAVLKAIAAPREIDMARVDAQQARRILDRIVGFKVSPLLWRSLPYGFTLSAGRVQSVALRLLVEREREILSFVPAAYWVLGVEATKTDKKEAFLAKLSRIDGKKPEVKTPELAAAYVNDLDGAGLRVASVKTTPKTRHPYPPFTTSSLQQAASSVCGFSPNRCMSIAQKLYESGLITYMRTDSVKISDDARKAAAAFIAAKFGSDYLPPSPNFYKSRSGAQEGHEAIRPTDVNATPSSLQLEASESKLYSLIWRRFVGSQMADARLSMRSVGLEADKPMLRHNYLFTASATSVEFDGFLAVMNAPAAKRTGTAEQTAAEPDEDSDEVKTLPPLEKGDALTALRWLSDRKETKPPSRYSEASLVKALEENGVGRPSTYAATIEVLTGRKYAESESRQLRPTRRGMDVNDWLVAKLESLFNVGYTAQMESQLDEIEAGREGCNGMLSAFYSKFSQSLEAAKDPPPPAERVKEIFAFLDEIKTWREPAGKGKKVFNEQHFVQSVRQQFDEAKTPITEKQLTALAKIATGYCDQVADGEKRLGEMGWAELVESRKNAPADDFVKWCFELIEKIPELETNAFIKSLRSQFESGRSLSQKQLAVLVRAAGENTAGLENAAEIQAKLAVYCPEGFSVPAETPEAADMLALLDTVTEWNEPVKRGKRVFDDKDFIVSLREQYARRKALTERQLAALRRICGTYHAQIPTFADVAERLKLKIPSSPARAKKSKTAKSAKSRKTAGAAS